MNAAKKGVPCKQQLMALTSRLSHLMPPCCCCCCRCIWAIFACATFETCMRACACWAASFFLATAVSLVHFLSFSSSSAFAFLLYGVSLH